MAPKRSKITKKKTARVKNNSPAHDEDNKSKFELLTNDFEEQFEQRIQKLQDQFDNVIKVIKSDYELALYHIPGELKDMKMSQLFALGEAFCQNQLNEANKDDWDDAAETEPDKQESSKKSWDVSDLANKIGNNKTSTTTVKKLQRKGSIKKSARKLSRIPSKENLGTKEIEGKNEVIYTPQGTKKRITSVTPKVDLNKPVPRSMTRKPRIGEILLSLSGSPIYINPRSGFVEVPGQSGKLHVSPMVKLEMAKKQLAKGMRK